MAIVSQVDIITNALWPQGDIRDPLGVWGFRLGVTGDATGGEIKVQAQVPANLAGRFVYTCYSLTFVQLAGATVATAIQARLLTNWPNVDPIAGVQGYASTIASSMEANGNFSAPIGSPDSPLIGPLDRFLLLFDPRASAGILTLIELKISSNVDTITHSFEGYGYFWDRSVLNAPGGPRHPGSS